MAELFIELLSEEIPSRLQIDARKKIKEIIDLKLKKEKLILNQANLFQHLKDLFFIEGVPEKIEQKKKIIKGPSVKAPQEALDGFIKSNNLNKTDVYKKS